MTPDRVPAQEGIPRCSTQFAPDYPVRRGVSAPAGSCHVMWGDWPVQTNLSLTARNRRSGGPATVPVGGAGGAVAIPTMPAVVTAEQD